MEGWQFLVNLRINSPSLSSEGTAVKVHAIDILYPPTEINCDIISSPSSGGWCETSRTLSSLKYREKFISRCSTVNKLVPLMMSSLRPSCSKMSVGKAGSRSMNLIMASQRFLLTEGDPYEVPCFTNCSYFSTTSET